MCIGGGGGGPTKAEIAAEDRKARLEDKAKRDAEAQKRENEKQQKLRIDALQKQAMKDALVGARVKLGEDYPLYAGDILSAATKIEEGLGPLDKPNSSTFADLIEGVTPGIETKTQESAIDQLKKAFPQGWESGQIPGTIDDTVLAAINEEQKKTATDYVKNLLARDVITTGGAGAAYKNIDTQAPGVLAQLEALGQGAISTGQSNLTKIISDAAARAGDLGVGDTFDVAPVQAQVKSEFDRWLAGLDTAIRGGVTGNLYTTSGLPVIAGAAGFAGNTAFDPKAIAGIFEEDDKDEEQVDTSGRVSATSIF